MSLHRFFIPPQHVHGDRMTIDDPKELHHLSRVLRLAVGDRVACVDGQGTEYLGTITTQAPEAVTIHIDQRRAIPQAEVEVWLGLALVKADRFELAVQKATELGVSRLTPLVTDRTVARPEQAGARLARWQRISREAAKQSARAMMPTIDAPYLFREFLPLIASVPLVLIPTLAVPSLPLQDALSTSRRRAPSDRSAGLALRESVVALIGPEGDFTVDEVRLAQAHGALPVSLGSRPLKSETAALALLSILSYAL